MLLACLSTPDRLSAVPVFRTGMLFRYYFRVDRYIEQVRYVKTHDRLGVELAAKNTSPPKDRGDAFKGPEDGAAAYDGA